MDHDRIERQTLVDAPVDRVWEILTSADHLGSWFAGGGAEIDLRPGGRLVLRFPGHPTSYARIERVDPPRRFAFRWRHTEDGGATEPGPENSTLVEFTLERSGDATRVTVVESGFATLALDEAEREAYRTGNVEGWRVQAERIAAYAQRTAV